MQFIKNILGLFHLKILRELKKNTAEVSEKFIASNYINEINRRSSLMFSEIDELAEDIETKGVLAISNVCDEPENYGGYFSLMKYINNKVMNLIPPSNFFVQHGYVFEMTDWMNAKKEGINFVWSDYVEDLMRKHTDNKHIYPIGAPFFYSESLLSSQEIQDEKIRLGKNLLAFPLHSTTYYDINYDNNKFLNILKGLRNEFDSIRICLYWKDIQRGLAIPYINEGFECVCCGHINDILFLERQRSLLEIADATISNGIGSYIGYSIYLKKPHWLVPEKFDIIDTCGTEAQELKRILHKGEFSKSLYHAFSNNSDFTINQEQVDLVDIIWGVSSIKSKKDLKTLINMFY